MMTEMQPDSYGYETSQCQLQSRHVPIHSRHIWAELFTILTRWNHSPSPAISRRPEVRPNTAGEHQLKINLREFRSNNMDFNDHIPESDLSIAEEPRFLSARR
ncbi:hypothetical protein RB195_011582 [Necator americanus]